MRWNGEISRFWSWRVVEPKDEEQGKKAWTEIHIWQLWAYAKSTEADIRTKPETWVAAAGRTMTLYLGATQVCVSFNVCRLPESCSSMHLYAIPSMYMVCIVS